MEIVTICVSFIAGLLGVAYPILFQVVSQLDDKYKSVLIIELFNKESGRKYFVYLLVCSITFLVIYLLKFQRFESITFFVPFFDNSALILLCLFTLGLIISFFLFVSNLLKYYTPHLFLDYLIKKHKTENEAEQLIYFSAISDILCLSIRQGNITIARTISDFFYTTFNNYRVSHPDENNHYPFTYYDTVYKTVLELVENKNKRLSFLEENALGGGWLIGDTSSYKISEHTYNWTWQNLIQAIDAERDDLIMRHWKSSHQFITHNLQHIAEEYSADGIINEDIVNARKKERQRFLEFHYALGGLLLYSGRINCIKRIFSYTQSIPPDYELLPDSMNEVFSTFMKFADEYSFHFDGSQNYVFPNLDGSMADYTVKSWVCKYIAILFIRQYSLIPYLIIMKPLDKPQHPVTQLERKYFIEKLPRFKQFVTEIYNDKELLATLNFNFITDSWCLENRKQPPYVFIDSLKLEIEEKFKMTKEEQLISPEKLRLFNESTQSILVKTFELYNDFIHLSVPHEEFKTIHLSGGSTMINDKSAFAENQELDQSGSLSALAKILARTFRKNVEDIFYQNKTDSYILRKDDIILAINKFNVTKDFIIVCFGERQNSIFKDVEQTNFNLIFLPKSSRTTPQGLLYFIIKKDELPKFIFTEIEESKKEKYKLEELDKSYNLYSSVNDLNKMGEIRHELEHQSSYTDDYKKSVLVNIAFSTEMQWKKDAKYICIGTYDKFADRGLPNSLSDIVY